MTTGSEFAQIFLNTPYRNADGFSPERESIIAKAFSDGDVPDFILNQEWLQIVNSANIGGTIRSVRLWVSPFLALGINSDPLYTCMMPETAQTVAKTLNAHILSKKLVRDYFNQSQVKIAIQVPGSPLKIPGPDMVKPEAIIRHNSMILKASGGRNPADFRISGHSKNIVVGPNLQAGKLAIYGGYTGIPGNGVDGWCYQSYPGPHPSDWVDYSQLVQLVFGVCELDGVKTPTRSLFLDPHLNVLVSDQGAFDPLYPNLAGGVTPTRNIPPSKPPSTKPPLGRTDLHKTNEGSAVVFGLGLLASIIMVKGLTK